MGFNLADDVFYNLDIGRTYRVFLDLAGFIEGHVQEVNLLIGYAHTAAARLASPDESALFIARISGASTPASALASAAFLKVS